MTTRAGISGRFRSLLGFALLLLMVCSTSTWAQEAATAAAITQSPAVDDCLHRSIPLTVLMKPDNLELQSIHLAIRSGDTNASVLSLQKEKISPRVILLLDASGSMAGTLNWKWKNALLAGAFALDAIPSQSQVALVTFNREIHISGFKDRLAVNQELLALRNTKPRGQTALYDAVERSIQLFGTPQFGDSIFIVSDGADNYGSGQPKPVSEELIRSGIRVFAFVVSDSAAKIPEERQGPAKLADLVKATGGAIVWGVEITPKWIASKEYGESVRTAHNQLQAPYRLELQLTSSPSKAAKLRITTNLNGLQLSYPQHIEPCSTHAPAAVP